MAVYEYKGKRPKIDSTVFIEESATIIGDVTMGAYSSVWPNAVIRGDSGAPIKIGRNVNIQDNAVIHGRGVVIGDNVTVGHTAILHGCEIGNNVLIGMGAIVMDGAKIDDWVLIGAGAIITRKTFIPSNSLVLGVPGKVVEQLDDTKRHHINVSVERYLERVEQYSKNR